MKRQKRREVHRSIILDSFYSTLRKTKLIIFLDHKKYSILCKLIGFYFLKICVHFLQWVLVIETRDK